MDADTTFIDESSLYCYISQLMLDEDIDFVAGPVLSQWQAIGVDALVHSIYQPEKRTPSGIVIIASYPFRPGISEDDFICNKFATVKFCYLKVNPETSKPFLYSSISLVKKGLHLLSAILSLRIRAYHRPGRKRKVIVATVLQPQFGILQIFSNKRLADKYYPSFAVIDEGTGSYASEKAWRNVREMASSGKLSGRVGITHFIVMNLLRIASCFLTIMAGKYIVVESMLIFHKERDELVPNNSAISAYKSVLEIRANMYRGVERNWPLAIIITTPYSEYGMASLAVELKLVDTIIDIMVKMGFEIIVKPHPTEADDKYAPVLVKYKPDQVRLHYPKIPAECLFATLHPACAIGYTSTSLVMADTLYNIPAITIIDILMDRAETEYQWIGAHDFKKTFAKIISYNADTFDKLKNILSSIKQNNGSA